MKSTGYGTFVQNIYVEIDVADLQKASATFGIAPIEIVEEENKATYFFQRETKKYGKDEDIIYFILMNIGLSEEIRWSIDWEKTIY